MKTIHQKAIQIAIGFDLDHTLGIDNHLEHDVLMDMIIKGSSITDTRDKDEEAIDYALFSYREQGVSLQVALGELFRSCIGEQVDIFALIHEFKNRCIDRTPSHMRAHPGLKECMQRLRAIGVNIAVLTNGWNPLQTAKLGKLGLSCPLLVSDDIGYRKPDVNAFSALRTKLGKADEFWYVGDNPKSDIEAARSAAFHTIWFDEGRAWPKNIEPPEIHVHSLLEIAEIFEARTQSFVRATYKLHQ